MTELTNTNCISSDLLDFHKEIHDSIHGYIKITKLACRIIDTPEFQRLRYLKQLGACYYVFPCAMHTRFEHSIGTYHLSDLYLKKLINNSNYNNINDYLIQIPELSEMPSDDMLNKKTCELVKIAALCHDIGHGPFSHAFDDIFIKSIENKPESQNIYHEMRSCLILENIIKNDDILKNYITPKQIKFMQNLINPPDNNNFIYQIVSNSLNNIDVDKFDYIQRDSKMLGLSFSIDLARLMDDIVVIDNKICFIKKIYFDIASLFITRYRLYKQIYTHKAVLAVHYMINDIMILIEPIINIYDVIYDMDKFIEITDEYIFTMLKILYNNKNKYIPEQIERINKAYEIWNNLNYRKLYKFIGSIVSMDKVKISHYPEVFNNNEVIIHKSKIGFVSGSKKNPLDEIYLYNKNDHTKCQKVGKEMVSFLINSFYQEYIIMFYIKNGNDLETIKKLEFIYGLKN